MRFTIYTDGSCPVNGKGGKFGRGGWASVCLEDEKFTVAGQGGGGHHATNNRMELLAVINGLGALPDSSVVTVHSDSQYVIFGFTKWMPNWARAGWPPRIKNRDLWLELQAAVERHHSVAFVYVKGHNGDEHNERADRLAGEQSDGG